MIYSVPKQTINIALLDVRVDSMAPRLAGGWGRYFITIPVSSFSIHPAAVDI